MLITAISSEGLVQPNKRLTKARGRVTVVRFAVTRVAVGFVIASGRGCGGGGGRVSVGGKR